MKIIIVTSRKGGAGKTTLTINLAARAASNGRNKTAVLDMDPQGSSMFWAGIRQSDYPVVKQLAVDDLAIELSELEEAGFDYVFIDLPPVDKKWLRRSMRDADLILIPTKPSPLDIHSASSTLEWASKASRKVAWVINGASSFSRTPDLVFEQLAETAKVCSTIVHERNDFVVSVGLGLSVQEMDPNSKAALEIESLWTDVKRLIKNS